MAITHKAIATQTLPNNSFSNILFSNIPQTYTDLLVVCSFRSNRNNNATFDSLLFKLNNNYYDYFRTSQGRGTQAFSFAGQAGYIGTVNCQGSTDYTFSNATLYIANYTSSNPKPFFSNSIAERNATGAESAYQDLVGGISNLSSGITSIDIYAESGNYLYQYSSATLYGIKNA